MESIDVTITNFDFEALDREIKRTMRRSARDAIQIGYMLKQMRDKKLWEMYWMALSQKSVFRFLIRVFRVQIYKE